MFKADVTTDLYKKKTSQAKFAVQLVKRSYSKAERSTSKCSGDHQYKKRKLSPNRMEAVKNTTFSVYPVKPGESKEDAWKTYKLQLIAAVARSIGLVDSSSSCIVQLLNIFRHSMFNLLLLFQSYRPAPLCIFYYVCSVFMFDPASIQLL